MSKVLQWLGFTAGLEVILWAVLAPWIFIPWTLVALAVLGALGLVWDLRRGSDQNGSDDGPLPAVNVDDGEGDFEDSPITGYPQAVSARRGKIKFRRSPIRRSPDPPKDDAP